MISAERQDNHPYCCWYIRRSAPLDWLFADCIIVFRFMEAKKSFICCWTLPKARMVTSINDRFTSLLPSRPQQVGAASAVVQKQNTNKKATPVQVFTIIFPTMTHNQFKSIHQSHESACLSPLMHHRQ